MKKIIILVIIFFSLFFVKNVEAINNSGYCLMELESRRVIFGRNIHERMPTASIAKIMTLIVAIKYGDLNMVVEITEDDVSQPGSSSYLPIGARVKLYDLLYIMNLRSGNDVAHAIACSIGKKESDFVYLMNETAKEIGMINSTFENATGLDETSINYSTPYDMSILTSYCYEYPQFVKIFEATKHSIELEGTLSYTSKHRLVKQKGIFLGGKTGYTKRAGRTLVSTAQCPEFKAVVVTFNDANDWNTHNYLFQKAFDEYHLTKLYAKGVIGQNEILLSYLPFLDEDIILPLKEDELKKVKSIIYLKENPDITAGKIVIMIAGRVAYQNELYPYYIPVVE